mmetsp:Transcript_28971/g.81595  ORF Transcript_28971/g.81595 Transcript_28971/m.81595 type:complete len:200 (+) Transcript_28971:3550-4149(+)
MMMITLVQRREEENPAQLHPVMLPWHPQRWPQLMTTANRRPRRSLPRQSTILLLVLMLLLPPSLTKSFPPNQQPTPLHYRNPNQRTIYDFRSEHPCPQFTVTGRSRRSANPTRRTESNCHSASRICHPRRCCAPCSKLKSRRSPTSCAVPIDPNWRGRTICCASERRICTCSSDCTKFWCVVCAPPRNLPTASRTTSSW